VWPGRRYWLWNLRLWVVVVVVFIVMTIATGGQPGDVFALALWTELWLMLSVVAWVVLFTGRAVTRAVRSFADPL
jgi:hypothetical protein